MTDDFTKNKFFNPEDPKAVEATKDIPPFVRTAATGDKVYRVKDGLAHWVRNPEVLAAVGGDFGMVTGIEVAEFRKLRIAEPIDLVNAQQYKFEKPVQEPPEDKPAEEELQMYPEAEGTPMGGITPGMEPVRGMTSIIIPAYMYDYSLFHYTGHCIGSVREHTDEVKTPYEIILILNGSNKDQFPNLEATKANKVIVNAENKGFGYAVNQGIRCSLGEYTVILNNDALVYNNWLPDFHEALEQIDLVMATPMYGEPYARAVEAAALRLKTLGRPIQESFSNFRDFACVCARKKLFSDIGLFDEQLFAYKEDLDLFNRMDKAGKKYASTKRVNVFHVINATSVGMTPEQLHAEEGKKHYEEKWGR